MDLASIGLSAVLSAVLFIVLEFTIILPLFKKIVTKAVDDMVNKDLIPSVTNFVDSKVTDLTETVTKSLYQRFKGFLGGRNKGVNSIINRLAQGEELDDIQDEYEESTIEKVLDVINAVSPYLPKSKPKTADPPAVDGIKEL